MLPRKIVRPRGPRFSDRLLRQARVGMDGRVCFPNDPKALNPSEYTMAKMFKMPVTQRDVSVVRHLGHRPGYLPNDHGFDVYEGIPYSNDMWAPYDPINKKWKIKG